MIDIILGHDPLRQGWNNIEDGPTFLIDGSPWRLVSRHRLWRPPIDIYETDENLVVRLEVAGMKESDFILTLRSRRLLIYGNRSDITERRAYHQMEIPFGEFSIDIELPVAVNSETIQASYQDGFLKIVISKEQSYTILPIEENES